MSNVLRGKFITFDGLDGSGLTDQVEMLKEWLRQTGYNMEAIAFTGEPSDGPAGTIIWQALENRLQIGEEALALLFAADRADHLEHFIIPRLNTDIHVISDRYYLSFLAYQSYLLPNAQDWLWQLNVRNYQPDLTIFLQSPPEICIKRIKQRFISERYERLDVLKGVNAQFNQIIPRLRDERGENVRIVDSSGSMETTHQMIKELISPFLFHPNS